MKSWSENLQLTSDDETFALCEVAALMSMLRQRGINVGALLGQCDLPPEALNDATYRISLAQHCRIHQAGAALYGDSTLFPAMAQRLHLTTFGIAGYALLSSANLAELIRFADDYSPLLNLKFTLEVRVERGAARLCLLDRYHFDEAARASCAVLELAKIGVLFRDVLGDEFRPHRALCAGADAAQLEALSAILGCPVEASALTTEVCFDAALLSRDLPQSNASTHASCQRVCDELMTHLASRFNLERHVREILLKAVDRPPSLLEVADQLCVSQRTLRRRLDALNTSYNQILENMRKELAIRYLERTRSTTEQIAQLLGYSEAANFRHAFKRWTGKSPKEFRASHAGTAQIDRGQRASFDRTRKPVARVHHTALLTEATACWARPAFSQQFLAEAA